jgi:hypothetical protein
LSGGSEHTALTTKLIAFSAISYWVNGRFGLENNAQPLKFNLQVNFLDILGLFSASNRPKPTPALRKQLSNQ